MLNKANMSFSVRRVEDPAIYVRRNKPDIIGISNAWDNVADFKSALNRLEDNIVAADIRQKSVKKPSSSTGPVLKEISSETQRFGKVTRFQLLGENSSYKSLLKHSSSAVEIETRKDDINYSKTVPVSDISSIGRETYSKSSQGISDRNGYSPSRYTVSGTKRVKKSNDELPSFFKTTTINPVVLNETSDDPNHSKVSSFANTAVNSSSNSQQFSLTSSPSLRRKAVLSKNEAALQKIKEKVQKQKAILSRQDEEINDNPADRKLHDSKEHVAISTECPEKNEIVQVPLKRKVRTTSASGPTYKGFNSVSNQTTRKCEQRKPKMHQTASKTLKADNNKGFPKPLKKQETKLKKVVKMNRITGARCPKEVISTTSWRDGQATVKKILGARKVKPKIVPERVPEKTDTTHSVTSPSQEDLSEGKLSDEDDKVHHGYRLEAEKVEDEKKPHGVEEVSKLTEVILRDSDVEDDQKLKVKDVLSTEAQSMLAELARDTSESEDEMKEEEKAKASEQRKKILKAKRPRTAPKPVAEEKYPKEKTRHYDQTEVQKYMAQQMAERKKKQKQEKILKKKQEEEKQRRLKELYERQKKSIAVPKKDKRFGQTYSCSEADLRIPRQESYRTSSEEHVKTDERTSQNESDKENTDVDESNASLDSITDGVQDDNASLREEFPVHSEVHNERFTAVYSPILNEKPVEQVFQPALSLPLDKRAQRLSALQATALALQTRLKSQALRLGAVSEHAVSEPVSRVEVQTIKEETGFQGILPGVTNIRRQADDNEKQVARVEAVTKIQAAYRGYNVRKRHHWKDGNTKSLENSRMFQDEDDDSKHVEGSKDDLEYSTFDPLHSIDRLRESLQLKDYKTEGNRFQQDVPVLPSTHFSISSVPFEPRGDRYSVMNIFTRRHPTITVEDILDEQPGSETISLLQAEGMSRTSAPKMEYEDDFTGEDISTASVLTEGDLKKESPVISKEETYSECFESDDEHEDMVQNDSVDEDDVEKRSSGKSQPQASLPSTIDDVVSLEGMDNGIVPVMTSTMHPERRPSPPVSLSDESELVRQARFIKVVQREGGNRLSPDSLQRKLTAEINLLENVEDSVRQVNDIEKTRAVSLAQQETVSLAQILKARQHNHEQELHNLRLKAKDEAIQAAKDLEKTRQAAALAASSAAEKLAEIQSEAIKTNFENSKRHLEEASKMASNVVSNTTRQIAEFCKDVTATTSTTIKELHKTDRPTTTLVERATSYSEGHATNVDNSNNSGREMPTSDTYSHPAKSWETSPSVASDRQQGYSSDEFESYLSGTGKNEESEVKTKHTRSISLSVESILEDLPGHSASDDDTTMNDESANDTQSLLTEKSKKQDKGHRAVSPFLDYSSQFEDSSHAPTDDDMDCRLLLPSKEHWLRSIKRMKDHSFEEDKGKEKILRTPFESDDSFGKFTVEMIQQYMREEEVRTKHQSAILRLREKSLKEKTKAELQWLEQLKKRSRDKGSDDVMPSIKKRKRGILMKLKAEKEEIKCLKAANRYASYQRRFMMYQQQEIHRLHQVTMNIRQRIEGDVYQKGSQPSSHEPSQNYRKSSSLSKTDSSSQSSPSDSSSKIQKSLQTPVISSGSPSARSVSEDIVEEPGTPHVSPVATGSPVPSYSTPKTEPSKEVRAYQATQQQQEVEPETSTILDMLSVVASGEPEFSNQNGERLLKIHKMLIERQQKLVKDESAVNSMLQKVTEMINNQRNNVTTRSHGNSKSESVRTPTTVSDTKETKPTEVTRNTNSRTESSILEELPSIEKTISEEFREDSEKPRSEYENCSFESDATSPSRPSSVPQASSHNGEIQIEEEPSSLTETSDYSDYEERIRRLKEEIQREKMKADALEKKKRKIKRNAMRQEVLNLENELKNTREDIHRKLAEMKTATAFSPSPPHTPPSIKSNRSSRNSLNGELPVLKRNTRRTYFQKPSERSSSDQQKSYISPSRKNNDSLPSSQDNAANDEVEESLIETLHGPPATLISRDGSEILDKNETSDIPEEISEHAADTDTHSTTTIPEETGIPEGEQDFLSQASDIPEEIYEKSNTEPKTSHSIREGSPSVVEDFQDSHEETFKVSENEVEDSYIKQRHSLNVSEGSPSIEEDLKDSCGKTSGVSYEEFVHSYTEPRSSTSISDGSPFDHDKQKEKDAYEEHYKPKSDTSIAEPTAEEDLGLESKVSSVSQISENLPAVTEDERHISEISNENIEKTTVRTGFPSLKIAENSKLLSKDTPEGPQELHVLSLDVSSDTHNFEKSMPIVLETSNKLARRGSTSEKLPLADENARNGEETEEGKSLSQASSIAEEISSGYDNEDISERHSTKEEYEKLIFGDIDEAENLGDGLKQVVELDYSDTFTHTSVGNIIDTSSKTQVVEPIPTLEEYREGKIGSPRSQSSMSEKVIAAEKMGREEEIKSTSHRYEGEQHYSADFEFDDETISDVIPEIPELDEEGDIKNEDEKNDSFEIFKSDHEVVQVKETGDESRAREEGLVDDITNEIYREIMDDSLNCVTCAKNAKSRQIAEQRELSEAREKVIGKGDNLTDGTRSARATVDTDGITKELLTDAIMQIMEIKKRKRESLGTTTPNTAETKAPSKRNEIDASQRAIPTGTTSPGKSPGGVIATVTSPLSAGSGFDAVDELTVVNNALIIAKSNRALNDDALRLMDQDIEGLLGAPMDDEDGDFPVNENKFSDIPSDDTEPSIHESSPMFAVPHNLQEMTSIVNPTVDILLARKQERMPLEKCEPTAQMLDGSTENEFESRSTRSYRNLIFHLTKEVFIDIASQNEIASRPPWAKAKWKGGQKLSRNFRRWKSDDEVRAVVLERVTNLIGLGAPRTTMQTLLRKTPVRGNKKDNVDAILIEELREEEPQWTDYDEDETAVKFQVADSILSMLLDDTVRVFNAIQAGKDVPDNVLVV